MDGLSAAIQSQGFAVVPDVFEQARIDQLLADLTQHSLTRSRAGIRHAMQHPAVRAIAHDLRLLEMASAVLGTQALPYRATLFDKSPNSNWLVVWHQDTALPLQQQRHTVGWGPSSMKEGVLYAHAPAEALREVLTLRLHLDDSTGENGPLRVLPTTQGVLTDDAIHALSQRISPVDCVVSRGGVLAMRPLLVHASSKSRSERPRRVLHIEYASEMAVLGLGLAVA